MRITMFALLLLSISVSCSPSIKSPKVGERPEVSASVQLEFEEARPLPPSSYLASWHRTEAGHDIWYVYNSHPTKRIGYVAYAYQRNPSAHPHCSRNGLGPGPLYAKNECKLGKPNSGLSPRSQDRALAEPVACETSFVLLDNLAEFCD